MTPKTIVKYAAEETHEELLHFGSCGTSRSAFLERTHAKLCRDTAQYAYTTAVGENRPILLISGRYTICLSHFCMFKFICFGELIAISPFDGRNAAMHETLIS